MNTRESVKECFVKGGKYTIFKISEASAMTVKFEILVDSVEDDKVVFKYRGKRKLYVIPFASRSYQSAPLQPFNGGIFEGWDLPISCDTDGQNMFRGNALYNFIGEKDEVRKFIEDNQLNPYFEASRSVAHGKDNKADDLVFQDLYTGGHAVINRMLEGVA